MKTLFILLLAFALVSCGSFKSVKILHNGEKAEVGNIKLYNKGDTVVVYYKSYAYNWVVVENWPKFEGDRTLSGGIWVYKAVVQ